VVIDELHTYRGVFGSHVAHVLARLRRVAAFHGAPVFICATATIGNPREHAARLLGVTTRGGRAGRRVGRAPRGAPRLPLQPARRERGARHPRELPQGGRPPHGGPRARARAHHRLRPVAQLGGDHAEVPARGARAAGLPDGRDHGLSRRATSPRRAASVERGLREGEILCVVATNALELGIDIGDLDAVVCAGYPGSVAGTWQRFGRAGRRGKTEHRRCLVTSSAAIDQYLASPRVTSSTAAIEDARIDPSNTEILIQHLKCAAFELPSWREPYGTLQADETATPCASSPTTAWSTSRRAASTGRPTRTRPTT
jgi:DEAD/DEAH box helicase domain-containing protein